MAVNVKYYHEYKPTLAGQYRINLCDSDFTGSESAIEMTSTPFTLNWNNDDPHARVISSECTMNFICETQAQIDWFEGVAARPTGEYTVEILKGASEDLFWCGVIQADSISIPYLSTPVVITFTANDDLARLADSFHNQTGLEGGTPYSETNELIHVHLRRCFIRLRTAHHWENADTYLQLLSYYETTSGDGLTALLVPSGAWDISDQGNVNEAKTDLDVLEQMCMIFNSRIIFYGGIFHFHSLAQLESAVDYEADVINYTKGGTLYSPVTFDLEEQFSDITKLAGWNSQFLPALKSVRMSTTGGFLASWGRRASLPHFNQIVFGNNELDGTFYNDVGTSTYLSILGEGNGFFVQMQPELTLVQIHLIAALQAFQLSESNDVDECVRVKVSILHFVDLYGTGQGTKRYAKRTATFDTDATQPIIGEQGQVIECASVEYSDITWTTNAADRLVYYSAPFHCGGNNARSAGDLISIQLPAVNASATSSADAAVPRLGGLIEIVKHDGTALSSGNQTTVNAAWAHGYFLAPSVYSGSSPVNTDPDVSATQWTATQTTGDYRENLDLGTTAFGISPNNPAFILDSSGNVQTDFTSSGNADGTDYIAQLVVKDVLRLRSKPRRLFTGNGMLANSITFPFNKIYTDGSTRYALLGASIDGASNITSVTFFELYHDSSTTISDTDIPDKWRTGSMVTLLNGMQVLSGSTTNLSNFINGLSTTSTTTKVDLAVSRILKKEERRMIRGRVLENGSMLAFPLDPSDTTTPNFTIFKANDGSGTQTEHSTSITSNAAIKGETIILPQLGTTAAKHFMTMTTVAGGTASMLANVAFGTTAGHVLQMVDVSGTLVPQFAAAAGGGQGGGFYTVSGYRTFKGTGAVWFSLIGETMTTDATSPLVNYAVTEDGTVSDFSIYSAATTSTSASMRLYKNGSTAETETVTLGVDATSTGTFSTSVSAGDIIRFQISPLANPGGAVTLTVKIEVT